MEPSDSEENQSVQGYFLPLARHSTSSAGVSIDIGRMLRQRFKLIVAGTLLFGIAFLLLSFLVTPKYRSEILLAPIDEDASGGLLSQLGGSFGGIGALAGVGLGGTGSRNEYIAILQSRELTVNFIKELDLLPILFADRWDSENDSWKADATEDIPTLEEAFRKFDEDIRSIVSDRETGLVTLTVTWNDREQAATWANALASRANSSIRERAIGEYEKSIAYLNEQLSTTTVVGARQAIYSVIESQIEKVMLANVREDYAFKILDPATPPDAGDFVFPNRLVFLLGGLILGLLLSLCVASFLHLRSESRSG